MGRCFWFPMEGRGVSVGRESARACWGGLGGQHPPQKYLPNWIRSVPFMCLKSFMRGAEFYQCGSWVQSQHMFLWLYRVRVFQVKGDHQRNYNCSAEPFALCSEKQPRLKHARFLLFIAILIAIYNGSCYWEPSWLLFTMVRAIGSNLDCYLQWFVLLGAIIPLSKNRNGNRKQLH